MKKLKQYAQQRITEFKIRKPKSYDESLYRKIQNEEDVEFQFKYADNIIQADEKEGNAGYVPDNEVRDLVIFNAYKALEKVSVLIGELEFNSGNSLISISQEQFDKWCDKLHDLITRRAEQNSRYASRGDVRL